MPQHSGDQASCQMCSIEQIRRREVSCLLKKINFSPEEENTVERLSYSLVTKIFLDPVFEVMVRAELQALYRRRDVDSLVSRGAGDESCS